MRFLQGACRRSLAVPSLFQHFFDVPIRNIAGISLVKANLQQSTELLIDYSIKLIAINEHVNSLRMVVQQFDRTALAVLNRLTLFF